MVDHIDGDKTNNVVSNLRWATRGENRINSKKKALCSSNFKGVRYNAKKNSYWASIENDIYLGYFKNEIDAAKAYDKKAKEMYGEYARLNFPEN